VDEGSARADMSPTRFDMTHKTRPPWYLTALSVGVIAAVVLVIIAVVSFANPSAGP
jgi:negative regulator of sigma E activity